MTYQTEGIILRRWNYKEADRMVRLLTPDHGKIMVRAISVRKHGAKLASHTEPLVQTQVFIARSKTIDILAGSQVTMARTQLRSDLVANALAHVIVEVLDRFTHDADADPVLYNLLESGLNWLNEHPPHALVANALVLQILGQLGYHLGLYECHQCKRPLTEEGNAWQYDVWSIQCSDCKTSEQTTPIHFDTIKLLRFLTEKSFADAARLKLTSGQWQELDYLIRRMLEYHVDGGMKSWRVLDQLCLHASESKR